MVEQDPDGWDLVLTDWSMPQMSGDRLAESVHALRPGLPVILCTGRGDQIEQFAALGLAAILTKPVFGHKLIEAIDRVMNERSAA